MNEFGKMMVEFWSKLREYAATLAADEHVVREVFDEIDALLSKHTQRTDDPRPQ
jgi:hypothetical protein